MTATKSTPPSSGPSLNVYKKIAIIRKPSDILSYEDTEGNIKSVSAELLGDAISNTTLLHAPSSSTSNNKAAAKPKEDIPVPLIRKVGSYETDVSATYQAPLSYVRCHRPTPEELKETLEYVVDEEDEAWLENNSKFGGAVEANPSQEEGSNTSARPPPRLSLALFERMMDILEKETAFDSIITSTQADEVFRKQIPEFYVIFPAKSHQGVVTSKHVLNDVYQFWMQKRSKLKRPLFRRFWPVTSLDDTNPHLVFRPREKEKYKLRKKRQNDMDAYRKMKQLRQDFDTIRHVLALIRRREELSHQHLKIKIELHRQKLYDLLDTSGTCRESNLIRKGAADALNAIPAVFDTQTGSRNRMSRHGVGRSLGSSLRSGDLAAALGAKLGEPSASASTSLEQVVAGQSDGEPAPNFLQPLSTRESYVTSWEGAVPHMSSYQNSHPDPTHTFRYRPRIGRGGRVCIDRLPREPHPSVPQVTVFTASKGMPLSTRQSSKHQQQHNPGFLDSDLMLDDGEMPSTIHTNEGEEDTTRLLDLLPRPLDAERSSRRIEELCSHAIFEDHQAAIAAVQNPGPSGGGDDLENDGDEVVVRLDSWVDTDEHLWGEERHSLGPV